MNKQQEETMNILKQLSNLVDKLLNPDADSDNGYPSPAFTETPAEVKPVADTVPEEVIQDRDARSIALKTKMQADFVKLAKEKWGMNRELARDTYRAAYGKSKRIVSRTTKLREKLLTDVNADLWVEADAHAASELAKISAPDVVPEVKPLEPQPVKAPDAALLTPPTEKVEVTGTLISAVAPEGSTELPQLVPGPKEELIAIGNTARERLTEQHGLSKALTYIREKTGFGLLEAKMWVDLLPVAIITEYPIILKTAMDEFIRRRMLTSKPSLGEQVSAMRKATLDKEMNPEAGKAEGQKKIDLAGDKKSSLVQIARRIARELAVNGPITIDDVTKAMSAHYNVLPVTGKHLNMWKGSVFTKSEWRYIGDVASNQKSAHARPVGLWALKSWLSKNTMNGKDSQVSSYVLSRLYKDFEKKYPTAELDKCECLIGEECIATETKQTIVTSGDKLYRIPVKFIPGAVGALIKLPAVSLPAGSMQFWSSSMTHGLPPLLPGTEVLSM